MVFQFIYIYIYIFFFFLREAAVAIAMKIVSYVIATLVRYPLQKCSSVSVTPLDCFVVFLLPMCSL